MRRISTTNKATDLFGPGKHGWKNGVPGTADRPTEGQAEWFNAIQEEICSLIEAAGLSIDAGDSSQVLAALAVLFPSIAELSETSGAGLVGTVQAGPGAVLRTVQSVHRERISPADFGCLMDNVTDDTVNFQKCINSKGHGVPITIKFPPGVTMYVAGTIYLPPLCNIEMNNSGIRGSGDNTVFESGYWSGGAVVSNFGQANETQIVVKSSIRNGFISNCAIAFNLFNFCESSVLADIHFAQTDMALYAKRCFYGKFSNLLARTPLTDIEDQTNPCFWWHDSVNNTRHEKINAVGYKIGLQFSGVKQAPKITLCGGEDCTTALNVLNSTESMKIENFYSEGSETCFNFDAGGTHTNVDIDFTHMLGATTAISGSTIFSGRWGRNNVTSGAAISLGANFSNGLNVEIPKDSTADNAVPTLPASYTLGDTNIADFIKSIYDSASGLVIKKAKVHAGKVPATYNGSVGVPKAGTVAFGSANVTTNTVTIDTSHDFTNWDRYYYVISVTDGAEIKLCGDVCFGAAFPFTGFASKTVTPSSNGGKLRLVVSGLTAATAVTADVRALG